ncbi:hypothetical protein V6Z11_A09G200500 [Gossypium hirsutum]
MKCSSTTGSFSTMVFDRAPFMGCCGMAFLRRRNMPVKGASVFAVDLQPSQAFFSDDSGHDVCCWFCSYVFIWFCCGWTSGHCTKRRNI